MINNMIDKILDFCNGNITLLIILLSLTPLLEIRIAIPFALSTNLNIDPFTVFSIAVSSTLIIIPLILLLLKPIIKILNKFKFLNKISKSLENYFSKKADTLKNKNNNLSLNPPSPSNKDNKRTKLKNFIIDNRIYFYLFLFVSLPFPLTGYYTGSAIAAFLGLNFYKSVIAILRELSSDHLSSNRVRIFLMDGISFIFMSCGFIYKAAKGMWREAAISLA